VTGSRALLAGALAAGALSGCAPGTVRVAFRPVVGTELTYRVVVRTNALLQVAGRKPQRTRAQVTLQARQTVLSSDATGSTVRVILTENQGSPRVVNVRLDRAAQLIGVDAADRGALGDLGVAEIFPAAAGAPPDRPLRPGEHWRLASPVTLPQAAPSILVGNGRLVRLGTAGDRRTATIRTATSLPVVRRTESAGNREAVLRGTQHTTTTTTHDLTDGSVETADAVTNATYALNLIPPEGTSGPPLTGTLDLEVRSETVRLG
jgi:hypothetical protein